MLKPLPPVQILLCGIVVAFIAFLLLENICTQARIQLVDRTLNYPAYDAPRSLILTFLNALVVTAGFASLYQCIYYLAGDLVKAPPLQGILNVNEAKEHILNPLDSIYYSLVTLTTLGYGDFYAKSTPMRIIVIIQLMYGLFFLTVLISLSVGLMPSRSIDSSGDTHSSKRPVIQNTLDMLKAREVDLGVGLPQDEGESLRRGFAIQKRILFILLLIAVSAVVIDSLLPSL